MKNYEKPIVLANSDLSEGVYAASGAITYGCFAISYRIDGWREYTIDFDLEHLGNGHHSTHQILDFIFNQPVTFISASHNGQKSPISGTNQIIIEYNEHFYMQSKKYGYILKVETNSSETALEIRECKIACNEQCEEHPNYTW